jgi:hypothetical protein
MIKKLLIALIRVYWWTLSPVIGSVCRFQPSCSRYTAVCVERFGPGSAENDRDGVHPARVSSNLAPASTGTPARSVARPT